MHVAWRWPVGFPKQKRKYQLPPRHKLVEFGANMCKPQSGIEGMYRWGILKLTLVCSSIQTHGFVEWDNAGVQEQLRLVRSGWQHNMPSRKLSLRWRHMETYVRHYWLSLHRPLRAFSHRLKATVYYCDLSCLYFCWFPIALIIIITIDIVYINGNFRILKWRYLPYTV